MSGDVKAPEWLWYGEADGVDHVSFGRWPKHPCQARYKIAGVQPTEYDHPCAPDLRISELEKEIERLRRERDHWKAGHDAAEARLATARRDALEEAARVACKLENVRTSIPCPDGIQGCLVAHFRLGGGPIETAIRALAEEAPSHD